MSADATGGGELAGAGARVGGDRLADDQAIGNELADGGAGVGVGDLVDLVRVEPDLALTAAGDGARQALLGAEVDPEKRDRISTLCSSDRAIVRGGVLDGRGVGFAAGVGFEVRVRCGWRRFSWCVYFSSSGRAAGRYSHLACWLVLMGCRWSLLLTGKSSFTN